MMEDPNYIPGYSYDPIRKRHFRLVQESTLQPIPIRKCAPRKKLKRLKPTIHRKQIPNTKDFSDKSICFWKGQREMGLLGKHQIEHIAKRNFFTSSAIKEQKLGIVRQFVGHQLRGHSCIAMTTGNDSEHIFGIWKNSNGSSQWIHFISLKSSRLQQTPKTNIQELNQFKTQLKRLPTPGQITAACWSDSEERNSGLIGVTRVHSYGMLYDISEKGKVREQYIPSTGKDAVFSCAYSGDCEKLAFGLENSGFLSFRTRSQPSFHLPKNNDSFHCMSFSQDSQLLLSGSRKGLVYGTDFRNNPAERYSFQLKASDSLLSGLHCMRNERQIIVSGFENVLQLMDLRMMKSPVLRYAEHRNEHRRIPIKVDEDCGFLCSVGQDKMTRIWDLRDSKLIRSFDPPVTTYSTSEEIPVATLQTGWKGNSNVPAVFIAYANMVFVYSS